MRIQVGHKLNALVGDVVVVVVVDIVAVFDVLFLSYDLVLLVTVLHSFRLILSQPLRRLEVT